MGDGHIEQTKLREVRAFGGHRKRTRKLSVAILDIRIDHSRFAPMTDFSSNLLHTTGSKKFSEKSTALLLGVPFSLR